jgi:hypothetical protein
MKNRLHARIAVLFGLWLLFTGRVLAAQSYADLFVPDAYFVSLGAEAQPLPLQDLERAAFLASGLSPDKASTYAARLNAYLAQLDQAAGSLADPGARAEAALSFIHDRLMKAYRSDATTLDGILDTGLYNCVSSAVLYMIAARSLGLDVAGVRTSDHAFCVVRLIGRDVDVETTSPAGYDPGTKRAFTDSFGKVTGFAYVPPGDYARRSNIDDKELVGLILSNRVVIYESVGDYRASLRLGVDYDALVRDAAARSFLLDRVNNLASDLARRGDFAGAAALAAAARSSLGEDPRLAELQGKAAYMGATATANSGRWDEALDEAAAMRAEGIAPPELPSLIEAALSNEILSSIQKRDFEGARRILDARRSLAGPKLAASLSEKIGESELAFAVKSLPFRDGLAAADKELASGDVDRSTWERASEMLYLNEANRIARSGDWLAASDLAAEGAARVRGDGNLARAAAVYRSNFVAESHNHFAALYNAHDFAAARRSILASLALLPDDPTLRSDLALVDRAQAR